MFFGKRKQSSRGMESRSSSGNSGVGREDGSPKAHTNYGEIMSTLSGNDRWGLEMCEYQGFWCPQVFLEGVLAAQERFSAQPTDIVVSSFPKCGTTWLKALAFATLTRTRFSPSSTPLLTNLPHDCVPFLEIDLVQSPPKRDFPDLPLIATHIPYPSLPNSIRDMGCKIVYIFRDPKDAFVSAWHFVRRLTPKDVEAVPLEEAFELFCEGIFAYAPYWDHVLGYWKASVEQPQRVLLIKYEDLMGDAPFYVKRLAHFLGSPFSAEEEDEGAVQKILDLCSFENLSNLKVNQTGVHREDTPHLQVQNCTYFRRGKVGDWKNYLTPEMADKIDLLTEQKLGQCGLMD